MSAPTSKIRRAVLAALATPAVLGAVTAGAASTAQAHDNVTVDHDSRKTSGCPCYLWDEYDGTHFKHDAGGKGVKARIYSDGELVGKMEFHPRDEKIWVYDTAANNDAIYYQIEANGKRFKVFRVPDGDRYVVRNFEVPEGEDVTLYAFDRLASDGSGKDQITSITGTS